MREYIPREFKKEEVKFVNPLISQREIFTRVTQIYESDNLLSCLSDLNTFVNYYTDMPFILHTAPEAVFSLGEFEIVSIEDLDV